MLSSRCPRSWVASTSATVIASLASRSSPWRPNSCWEHSRSSAATSPPSSSSAADERRSARSLEPVGERRSASPRPSQRGQGLAAPARFAARAPRGREASSRRAVSAPSACRRSAASSASSLARWIAVPEPSPSRSAWRSASQLVRLASSAAWSSARRASRSALWDSSSRLRASARAASARCRSCLARSSVCSRWASREASSSRSERAASAGSVPSRGSRRISPTAASRHSPSTVTATPVNPSAIPSKSSTSHASASRRSVIGRGVAPGLDQVEQAAGAVLRRRLCGIGRLHPAEARARRRRPREPLPALADRADDRSAQPARRAPPRRPARARTRSRSSRPAPRARPPRRPPPAWPRPRPARRPGPPGARMPSAPRRGPSRASGWPVAGRLRSPPRRAPAARGQPSPPLGAARPPQPRGAGARPPRRRRRPASRARPRARRSAPPLPSRRAPRRAHRAAAGAPRGRRAGPARPDRGTPPGPERARWPHAPRRAARRGGAAPPLRPRSAPRSPCDAPAPPRSASRPSPAWRGPRRASPRRPISCSCWARRSSATICARSSFACRTSFAVRSAASAWRFRGRRCERASRSTSCARSRLSRVRSSLSWALWRRLRCLPRPAASSISRRRSRGFELTISSTLPWLITEWASRPMFVSERASTTSVRRQRAPFSLYSPSPLRSIRREIEISENSLAARPSELSITTSTSAKRRGRLAVAAGEDHVPHLLAADRRGALLAERPEHRVGDVRLAGAVRPDDHADARREGQPGAVGEGLEALQIDGLQIHRSRKGGRRRMRRASPGRNRA